MRDNKSVIRKKCKWKEKVTSSFKACLNQSECNFIIHTYSVSLIAHGRLMVKSAQKMELFLSLRNFLLTCFFVQFHFKSQHIQHITTIVVIHSKAYIKKSCNLNEYVRALHLIVCRPPHTHCIQYIRLGFCFFLFIFSIIIML